MIGEHHHVVTLGTSGGPRFWKGSSRRGIATAVVVNDGFYLVDAGHGVVHQMERAGLPISKLKGVFITHLHSDHIVDLNTLGLFGLYELEDRVGNPVPIFGPGDRGVLPPQSPRATQKIEPLEPTDPTPGTRSMFTKLMGAYATDLNDRIIDALRPSPLDLFEAQDIEVPAETQFHANDNPVPAMDPFVIFRDEHVMVSAILVEHPPIAPAFGFRFDTKQGSVVISGDTAFTSNMINISQDVGLLLHEAIDFGFVEQTFGGKDDETSRASKDHHYKSHTSVADAIHVAREAGAHRLALHHLVPGTDSVERWTKQAAVFDGEFLVPDDLDVISIAVSEGQERHHETVAAENRD